MSIVFKSLICCLLLGAPLAASASFTVCSYNCGCLSDHYDYIRAVCMHKLSQQRHDEEPQKMALLNTIQKTALKILFGEDPSAQEEWDREDYQTLLEQITEHPDAEGSSNQKWRALSEQIVTTYRQRPVVIHDKEVQEMLEEFCPSVGQKRREIAKHIFAHELKYDILALQEADYLDASLFPEEYEVLFSKSKHSKNVLAWKKSRFALAQEIGDVSRGFAAVLYDMESDRRVLVISGHLTGCNPFTDAEGDAKRGDEELLALLECSRNTEAEIKVIAMDSNVTATHPRLSLLKHAGFTLDCDTFLEPTCTNPWQVLDTRIDWIAVQSAGVTNIPVLGVGLNSYQTNLSDHKPIAARVLP